MKNGVYKIILWNVAEFYYFQNGEFFYPDFQGKNFLWQKTVMCPERAKKMEYLEEYQGLDQIKDLYKKTKEMIQSKISFSRK